MRKFLRFLGLVFLLLVFLASVGFSFVNQTPVGLSFGLWEFAPQPIAVWVISAFAIGGLLGLAFGTGIATYFRNRIEIRKLRKQLKQAEGEIEKLNSSPLRDAE